LKNTTTNHHLHMQSKDDDETLPTSSTFTSDANWTYL